MIWYHLYLNDLAPGETLILKDLLFECRAKINFYTHEGYNTLRQYTKIMSQILQQGVENGVFRSDINVILVKNLIFGLLDEESLNYLASGEIDSTLQDFDDIMDLVFAIISKDKHRPAENPGNKEERILKSAVRIFSSKGYNSATISEIAESVNVAESTIYTYFDNKRDLLFSIPKKRLRLLNNNKGEVFHVQSPIKKTPAVCPVVVHNLHGRPGFFTGLFARYQIKPEVLCVPFL